MRAVQCMVEHAPSSGALALWVGHADVDSADGAAVAAPLRWPERLRHPTPSPVRTDGRTLYYLPGFETLDLPTQTGWVAHGVLHIVLRHVQRLDALRQRMGDVDAQLYNLCADAIVNSALSHLRWLQLPPGALTLPMVLEQVLHLEGADDGALLAWDVERLYQAVDDRAPPQADDARRSAVRARIVGRAGGRADGAAGASTGGAARDRAGGGHGVADVNASRAGALSSAAPATATRAAAVPEDGPPDPGEDVTAARDDGPRSLRLRALGRAYGPDLQAAGADANRPEDEAEEARLWRERLLRGHAGDGAHSMLRALLADLPRERTPWEQVLRRQAARALSLQPGLSWSRPTRSYLANQGRGPGGRRMPWEPGTTPSRHVPALAVVVDVSGSVDDRVLERFNREIRVLTRRLEAPLTLVFGDCAVRRVAHHAPGRVGLDDLLAHGVAGGGSTDFTPLLQEAERHRPDLIVVLTDLDGPARHRPRCPVLWAVPEACRDARAPFGQVLVLG